MPFQWFTDLCAGIPEGDECPKNCACVRCSLYHACDRVQNPELRERIRTKRMALLQAAKSGTLRGVPARAPKTVVVEGVSKEMLTALNDAIDRLIESRKQ